MGELTHISGRDVPLEVTIERALGALKEAGFELEIRPFLHTAGRIVSVMVQEKNHPSLFSNGKGYSQKAALASALAEFIERAWSGFFFQELYLGEGIALAPDEVRARSVKEILNPKWRKFYALEGHSEGWIDFQTSESDTILSLPFTRLGTQESILFPQSLLHNLYASNGIAAGNTLTEALVQALSEVIERAVKFEVIAKGYALPEIPRERVEECKEALEALGELESLGYSVRLKDASLGRGYPVVAAILINPSDAGAMMIFGAHPNFNIALSRTLSELLQGRTLEGGFSGLDVPTLDIDSCADTRNLESHFINSTGKIPWSVLGQKSDFAFASWGIVGSREEELAYLVALLEREGHEIFYRDCTRLGFPVVRVVVPGFSEVYPLEDMAEANVNEGKFYRAGVLEWEHASHEALEALLEGLEAFEDHRGIEELLGIVLEESCYFKGALLGELKLRIALFLGERDYALEGARWALEVVERSTARWVDYALLERTLSGAIDPRGVFPPECIARVESWLKGAREGLRLDWRLADLARRVAEL